MKNSKLFRLVVAATLFFAVILTSCGGGGLPNGRYAPVDTYMANRIQAIIIDGDNFTLVYSFVGIGTTVKYKYTNGTITFSDGIAAVGIACEYKDGILYYAGAPFKKTN